MHVPRRALSAVICLSLVLELIPVSPVMAYGTEERDDVPSNVSQEQLEEPSEPDGAVTEDELETEPEDDGSTTEEEIALDNGPVVETEEQIALDNELAVEAEEHTAEEGDDPDITAAALEEVEDELTPQEADLYCEAGAAVSDGVPVLGDAPVATDDSQYDEMVLTAQASATTPEEHTKQEIVDFIASHPFDITAASTYSVQPSTTVPYAAGEVSPESVQEALNVLNTLRFIAGVGSSVTNSSTFQASAQAAALIGCLNGSISHYPTQPEGLSDDLYSLGYEGAGRSNLAYGKTSAAATMLQYCDDLGSNNQGTVGHRRWLLSSRLGQVGIGQVSWFNATYVFDSSDPSVVTDVAWPARHMPTNFFGTGAQWSFATVTQEIGSASSISVTVTRRNDGKTWELSSGDITVNEVSSGTSFIGYDKNGCIVWSLGDVGSYKDGDVFDVSITGDRSSKRYTVEFFDLCTPDLLSISELFGDAIAEGETVTAWVSDTNRRYLFVPEYSDEAYPSDPTLRAMADDALSNVTVAYTSSNPEVATVAALGSHAQSYSWGDDVWIRGDWIANVTVAGVGTTSITATASNGTVASFKLVVQQKSIDPSVDSRAYIGVSGADLTYNGNAQHPTYSVRYNNSLLREGVDYQVVYGNNVNAGTGIATITGMGQFVGEVEMEFTIKPASLSSATIATIASQTYTGSEIVPAPVVTLRGKTLVAGTDYTVTYASNTNTGTAVVTVAGKGNYSNTRSAEFTIKPLSFDDAESIGVSVANVVYTGEPLTPEPVFSVNDRDLVRDVDYTVSYSNNTNAGTGRVTVTGKGNYTGTYPGSFTIEKARISAATISAIPDQVFTGSELKPDVTVTLDGRTLNPARDYNAVYSSNVNAGTATVRITGEGNYTGSTSAGFTILKVSMSDVTILTIPTQTYTGSSIEPDVVVTYGGKTLSKGTDYTVAYANNTQIGVATVTIKGKGNFTGSKDTTFQISNVSMADAQIEAIPDQYYTGDAKQPELVVTLSGKLLTSGTDYEVAYSDNINPGTATATITGIGIYGGTLSRAFEVTIPFVDANLKTPHVGDIGWLAESGISAGWKKSDGTVEFRPTNTVVRQDMAAFLFRLAKLWGLVDESWQPTGSVTFTDVNAKTPHYREIMWLAESGVSAGWSMKDGSKQFRPKNIVVRQDMAAFLRRLQALRDPSVKFWQPEGASPFRDVTAKTPHYDDILWLAESGVSAGWTMKDGSKEFRPTNTVIRQDMAAFLRRLDGAG